MKAEVAVRVARASGPLVVAFCDNELFPERRNSSSSAKTREVRFGRMSKPAGQRPAIPGISPRLLPVLLTVLLSCTGFAQDTIYRANGSKQSARVVGLDDRQIKLEVTLVPGQPPATITTPRGEVVQVDFAETEEEQRLLKAGAQSDPSAITRWWKAKEPFLALPNSNAGAFGLVFAQQLLKAPGRGGDALAMFERLEKADWNEARRDAAGRGKLLALISVGRAAEAVDQAKQLAINAEDPATLIEAKYVLAQGSFQDLRKLLDDNPRWEQDDNVRPERHRLYHETIDLFLYPFLFHGAEQAPAARGLAGALDFFVFMKEPAHAAEIARDLTVLYPGTTEAKAAAQFLAAHPQPAPATH